MSRTIFNITIDALATLFLIGMIATGYLLRFPLPPGTNKKLMLWGLSRHEWGAIHYWISIALLLIIFLHIAMHWSWIVSVLGKRIFKRDSDSLPTISSGIIVATIFIALFLLFAFAANRNIIEIQHSPSSYQEGAPKISKNSNEEEEPVTWKDVSPIFYKNCASCHSENKQFANFRADQFSDFVGPKYDKQLVVPKNVSSSALIPIITGGRNDIPMIDRHRLREDEIILIKKWITSGAREL